MSAKGRDRPFWAKMKGPSPIELLRDKQIGGGLRHFFNVTQDTKPNTTQMTKIRM